ncbi:RNA methyltransferase, RsmE family [Luminiphilus syltensis NOR5-1B]|uniref:Ribosomal RNA small subunit methyltransferase E n=1 Tax=Luminiphilus syltensis NOR5-1B TaxID=565045 RepID=B8KQK9_9GAMM|nr:16S rRNA (uracil(1498)-N(3))-methyltransferase [Luminiphilus syltensis]EED34915.1 RNA methyltransferase, RsmE family [Luminiphilus syltensis NOR5-1B]
MNILLLTENDWLHGDEVRLTDHRFQHIQRVLGAEVGTSLKVGLVDGNMGTGTITAIDTGEVLMQVALSESPPPRHPYDIALALPRPKMLRRVLRTVAEFGVGTLHLIHSWRVEKSYWQSPLLQTGNIQRALQAGLERSGDTRMPKVHQHRRFRPFIEDILPALISDRAGVIVHPGSEPVLAADQTDHKALILIGPEGGFIPFEVELACQQGVSVRSLGRRILSVDTALNTVLGRQLI